MPVMALGFIPRCIRRFMERFPRAIISLQMGNDGTVTRWMSSSYCDIGFVANVIDIPQVEHQPLYAVPGVCALPPSHRLASHDAVHARDLDGEAFISLSLEDGARTRVDRVFEDAGVRRQMTLETPFSAAICALVEQGLGLGLVNPIAADDYRHAEIVFRPFQPQVMFHGHAMFPSRNREDPLVEGFLSVVREELAGYQRPLV
jgi:DNA-binding transcriptional LysR family regulator